jgi:hypothetical protein
MGSDLISGPYRMRIAEANLNIATMALSDWIDDGMLDQATHEPLADPWLLVSFCMVPLAEPLVWTVESKETGNKIDVPHKDSVRLVAVFRLKSMGAQACQTSPE